MNKEDFENIFENDDFITSLLNSIEDENFYINDKEPVYTLRECLENIKGEVLSTIYLTYKQILTIDKKLKDKPTSKEMIDILEEEILRLFPEFLTTLNSDDKNILNESLKNKELEISNITLLNNGYMFGFTKNNKNVYVVPNEIKELYKEYVSNGELEKIEYNNAYLYIFVYMIINGFVPKEFLYKVLTCKYKLNITKKEINNMILKFCHEYKEYYSLFEVKDEGKEAIDSLLEIKNSIPYHILEEAELGYYFELIKSLHDEIDNILKKTNITGEMIVNRFILDDLPTEDLLSEFNLTKTQSKKIFDLMDEAKNSLRYWTYNGRTTNEFERDYWISNLTFNKKPKNTNLDSCLSILDLDTYDEIFNNFDEDGKLLDEKIINYAKKIAKEYEKFQIAGLINSNHEELNNLINFDEVSHGLVYFYEEDDKVKCLVPDEIIEIMHNAYHQKDDIEEYTENLISIYIDMNGVITKNKLQELLKEYHDIDISIKELDYKVRELDACIIKNKYYTWVEDFPIDAIEDLMVVKEAFNKYKKVNFENEYKESEFKDKVKDIIENENSKDDFIGNVYSIILHFAKNAVLDKESLNESLEDNGIILKEKTKKQIIDLYKDYKKYISVWYYNGHTILEYADIINKKSVKIGRNEPCPCGSGKKYKQCCGK